MSLVARHLEANGLPTVIIGSALDIVEHCGVPRYVFSDFPLGNPCGFPWRRDMQREIVATALRLLAEATAPRTTIHTPFTWWDKRDWRRRYNLVEPANRDHLLALGDARRKKQEAAKQRREKAETA